MVKKTLCLFFVLLFSVAGCISAFAYNPDPKYGTVLSEYEKGEFLWGAKATVMFQVTTKKMFLLNDVVSSELDLHKTETDGQDEPADSPEKIVLTDMITTSSPRYEGVTVSVYYAYKCPYCGKANGGSSVYSAINGMLQQCYHCSHPLEDLDSIKFYRFLITPETSAHYDLFKEYNFEPYSKKMFGDTAKDYGDGKDLSAGNLIYEEDESGQKTLVDFTTSKVKNGDRVKKYMLVAKINSIVTPVLVSYADSKFAEIIFKIRLFIADTCGKILTEIFS